MWSWLKSRVFGIDKNEASTTKEPMLSDEERKYIASKRLANPSIVKMKMNADTVISHPVPRRTRSSEIIKGWIEG